MKKIYIYGKDYLSEDDVHVYLSEKLNFPEYYGGNLSALYDVLTEMTEQIQIDIIVDKESSESEKYLEKMAMVIADAAEENANIKTEFIREEL